MKKEIVIVVIGIIRQKGKYLLTKRYQLDEKYSHGKWQLPGGGLEFHEKIEECLIRELKEEVGIEIKNITPIPQIFEVIYTKKHLVFPCFVCEPVEEHPTIVLDAEASEYGWFTPEEIDTLDFLSLTDDVIYAAEKIISL